MSLANKLSIEDVDLKGKRVLIRVSPIVGALTRIRLDLEDGGCQGWDNGHHYPLVQCLVPFPAVACRG
jgi:hypothetical protein